MADLVEKLRKGLAGRYAVEREIGRGGMSTVFHARDLKHDRVVAIKVLLPEIAAELGTDRFVREIRTAAQLAHPHILPLYDSGHVDDLLYFVMAYAEGATLRELLQREKQLPVEEALRITHAVARALDYAHARGVVHRDIKPDNILLMAGEPVVADFGIARAIERSSGPAGTIASTVFGTAAYMSPEQAEGSADLDGRSDLYSLGCLLYEILTGRPPYDGPTADIIVVQHRMAPIPDVTAIRKDVPRVVQSQLKTALAKSARDRPSKATAWATSMSSAEDRTGGSTNLGRRLGILTAVVAVTALVGWGLTPLRQPPSPVRDLIAITPFTASTELDDDTYGTGMVTLLSRSLDGAGNLRAVKGSALLNRANRLGDSPEVAGVGVQIARHFRADMFVTGSSMALPNGIRLDAAVYRTNDPELPIGRVHVEGHGDSTTFLVDQLASALIGEIYSEPHEHHERLAASTTSNLAALKHFLKGRDLLRGQGDLAEPAQEFKRAVELDSTFALAWYAFSSVAPFVGTGLGDGFRQALTAIKHAIDWSHRVPIHERALFHAWEASLLGNVARADSFYRKVLDEHPDDIETLRSWSLVQYNLGPLQGRSSMEAKPTVERMLQLDPANDDALSILIDMARRQEKMTVYDSLRAVYKSFYPGQSGYNVGEKLQRAIWRDDWEATAELAHQLRELRPSHTLQILLGLSASTGRPREVARFIDEQLQPTWLEPYPFFHVVLASNKAAQGQWSQAVQHLQDLKRLDPNGGFAFEVGYLLHPFSPVDQTTLENLVEPMARWDSMPPRRTPAWTTGRHYQTKIYLLGLLEARIGRSTDALARAAELDKLVTPDYLGALVEDFAHSVRATEAYWAGRLEEASEHISRCNFQLWSGTGGSQRYRWYERFLRAEIAFKLGNDAEALRWFESLLDVNGSFAAGALCYMRRGQIRDRTGQTERALDDYRRFVDRWQECDEALQPHVVEIERRIRELSDQLSTS